MESVFKWDRNFNIYDKFEVIDSTYKSKPKTTKGGYNITNRTIFHYKSKEHVDYLIREMRNKPLDDQQIVGYLGSGIYIKDTRNRIFVNCKIFEILDQYNAPLDAEFRKKFIFLGDYAKGKPIKYMDKVCWELWHSKLENREVFMSHILADIKSVFYLVSIIVNGVIGMDHSWFDYVDAYRKIPDFRRLVEGELITRHMSPYEINDICNGITKEFENNIVIHPLTDFYTAGVKVNKQQIQSMFCYGLIPNPLIKNMIKCDYPIVGGTLNGYLRRYDQYLADRLGRLNQVYSKAEIKAPGLLTKRLLISASIVRLNKPDTRETLDDCHSEDYILIKIGSEKDLTKFRYKNFYNSKGELEYVDIDRKDLIGKEIKLVTFMLCEGEDLVCAKCFGYNHKFFEDNEIQKNNVVTFIAATIAKVLQGVISLKHHLSANLDKIIVSYDKWQKIEFREFMENTDIIESMNFDIIKINKKYTTLFINNERDQRKSKFGKLFIDGKEFETAEYIQQVDSHTYIMSIPNFSVISKAQDLLTALSKHSKKNKYTGATDFDASQMIGKEFKDKVMLVYDYLKSRIDLPHFIYYEALVYTLLKDKKDIRKRATKDSEDAVFVHMDDIISMPERNTSITTGLIHGYINKSITNMYPGCQPHEFDILYYPLIDRGTDNDIFATFNRILDGGDPNEVKSISEDDFLNIND